MAFKVGDTVTVRNDLVSGFDVLAIDDVFNDKDIEYIQRLFLKYNVPIFVAFRTAILY